MADGTSAAAAAARSAGGSGATDRAHAQLSKRRDGRGAVALSCSTRQPEEASQGIRLAGPAIRAISAVHASQGGAARTTIGGDRSAALIKGGVSEPAC